MPIRLWFCSNPECTVILFKTHDGCCSRCHRPGRPINWSLEQGGK